MIEVRDISFEKESKAQIIKANQELLSKNEELRKVNVDLDNFIYTASHDLKSPISNIEGLMRILHKKLQNKIDESERTLIDLISESVEKFKKTINDLTDITKAQKQTDLETEQVSFQQILSEVQAVIREMIDQSQAVITSDLQAESILYARQHLRSILYNLLSNAIKYRSPDRQARIHISTSLENGFILLAVADNGLGLTTFQQSKIFDMFKRMHSHVEGTGIGLYIVKRMVENNGGKIIVESEPGKGTLFKVYLKWRSEED